MPQEASNKVRQLIDRDGVVAVIGEVASSRSMAGGLICNTKKVPMVTPSSTAVEVTKDREYVFRLCFTDAQQGDVAARFVHDTLKKNNVALFFVAQDDYSSGLARASKRASPSSAERSSIEKGYQAKETNFTTYLTELEVGATPKLTSFPFTTTTWCRSRGRPRRSAFPEACSSAATAGTRTISSRGQAASSKARTSPITTRPTFPVRKLEGLRKAYKEKYGPRSEQPRRARIRRGEAPLRCHRPRCRL